MEADKLAASLPLDMPSIEASTGLRALGDWHAAHGRWPETAARFESVLKVNQLDAADLVAEDQLKLAVALLQTGDRRGYEQFRQAEVPRLSRPCQHRLRLPNLYSRSAAAAGYEHDPVVSSCGGNGRKEISHRWGNAFEPATLGGMVGGPGFVGVSPGAFSTSHVAIRKLGSST